MENKTNIESIREWLRGCPHIDAQKFFRVDYIDDDPNCYAIYSAPSPITYRTDILGNIYPDTIQVLNYYFCIISVWGKDIKQNVENARAIDSVVDWIQAQNATKNFPTINEGSIRSILPTLSPQPLQQTAETAIYQISIQIQYRRK